MIQNMPVEAIIGIVMWSICVFALGMAAGIHSERKRWIP